MSNNKATKNNPRKMTCSQPNHTSTSDTSVREWISKVRGALTSRARTSSAPKSDVQTVPNSVTHLVMIPKWGLASTIPKFDKKAVSSTDLKAAPSTVPKALIYSDDNIKKTLIYCDDIIKSATAENTEKR